MTHPSHTIAAATVATAMAIASPAFASEITYRINGNVASNFMTAGGFSTAPIGAPAILQFTVDTTTIPSFTSANHNIWDAVPGTITALKATVNGLTSVVTPDTPDRARVVDDALLSSGPNHYDQFWMEMPAVGAAPDFQFARVSLSRVEPGPVVASSLAGIDWPTDASQLNVATFTNDNQLMLRGDGLSENLFVTMRNIEVFVPAPGVATLGSLAALGAIRRRRR